MTKITDFIPVGRENAISMDGLGLVSGERERNVRRLVNRARVNGEPICSACKGGKTGYYYPRNVNEALEYVRLQNARIKSAHAALRSVKNYIRNGGVYIGE